MLGTESGELEIGKNRGKLLKSQGPPRAVKLLLLLMMITKIASDMTKLNNIFSCTVTPCGLIYVNLPMFQRKRENCVSLQTFVNF